MGIAAYKSTIRESETPRQIERRILSRITGALERRAVFYDNAVSTEERLGLLHSGLGEDLIENQLFWNMLKNDLASKGNALSNDLRAGLISLALWVERETNAVMGGASGVGELVAVNHNIIAGLSGISTQPNKG